MAAVPLLRVGTEQDPLPAAAMPEHEALLAVLGTTHEPSVPTKKQVPLVATPGTIHISSALRTEQELLPAPVRALPQHGVAPVVRRALPCRAKYGVAPVVRRALPPQGGASPVGQNGQAAQQRGLPRHRVAPAVRRALPRQGKAALASTALRTHLSTGGAYTLGGCSRRQA